MEYKGLKIGDLISKLPIIQGGMGIGISRSKLAGAVAKAGGVGVISAVGIGFEEPDFYNNTVKANLRALSKEIKKAKEIAVDGIIGVNILVAVNNYKELVLEAVKAKVDLIISGAGLPMQLPELVKGSNTKIAPMVSSGKAARIICKRWDRKNNRIPDLIIVEGQKAGGHLGFNREEIESGEARDLEEIVVEVIEEIKVFEKKYNKKIPVVAAGGIFDGKDIAKFLKLGARGVQMGTRFIGTEECDADINYKKAFISAKEEDISLVKSPVGLPGRAIRNNLVKTIEKENIKVSRCFNCLVPCNPSTTPYCISQALIDAVKGDIENGLIFTGTNGYRINEITTVQGLINELEEEIRNY